MIRILMLAASLGLPAAARLAPAIHGYDGADPATLPARLSLTGLYGDVASATRTVTSGIVPYEVSAPLWSDGSRKQRFIALPPGTKVVPTDSDHYRFPDRTVLIKNFLLDSVHGDSTTRFLVETRFLILRATPFGTVYLGLSYKWRRSQADADLVDPGPGLDTVHAVSLGGRPKGKRWRYPSQADCTTCHFNRGVLGFLTQQLDRPSAANPAINQLQALADAGVLSSNPIAGKPLPTFRWAGLAETGTPPAGMTAAEWKARSWLAANCSQCHGNAHANTFESASHDFDFFRPGRKIAYADPDTAGGYVGKPSNLDPRWPRLIYAGRPESSLVLARMLARPTAQDPLSLQMPPLATYQPDSAAAIALRDWICALGKSGGTCRLPGVQADSTYWSTGLSHHGASRTRRAAGTPSPGRGAFLPAWRGALRTWFDAQGREIPRENVP